jgi:acetyl-CoA acetyltransferase
VPAVTGDVAVWGVGTSLFGKQPELSAVDLMGNAISEAFEDADVDEVDAVFVGSVFCEPGVAVRGLQEVGIHGVPIITIENACASGTSAFHEGQAAVALGRYECVLAVGVETMTGAFTGAITPFASDREGRQGMVMPAIYAMSAARYASEYGVTAEQRALVSVKNHENGWHNDRAQHHKKLSVDDVLTSRLVADPLTLLECCSISDAAAAAVIATADGNRRHVRVRASALRSGELWDYRSLRVWGWQIVHDTAAQAYKSAGLTAADVDVFEVHDAFTIGEIATTEALGLCAVGGGGRLVESGHTWMGGRQPVNPSGGLLARGHPLGATGLAQVAEIVWQLRGEAGARQVPNAQIGVVETMGGGAAGVDGNGCVVVVLGN